MRKERQPLTSAVWLESATEKNHAIITTPFLVHCSTRIARAQIARREIT
jgi:hypothetical protein